MKETNQGLIVKECKELSKQLNRPSSFQIYPFSNEFYFSRILERIKDVQHPTTEKVRVAILTGESYLLSSLPELASQADHIIINDINLNLLAHTTFLYQCLIKADTPEEFSELYQQEDNPLHTIRGSEHLFNVLQGKRSPHILGEKHFLHDQDRFLQCKQAASHLTFSWLNINLFSMKECQQLKNILDKNNAVVRIFNVSNVHHYDTEKQLPKMLDFFFKGNNQPIILYSIGAFGSEDLNNLCSKMTCHLKEYSELYDLDRDERHHRKTDPSIDHTEGKRLATYFNRNIIPQVINHQDIKPQLLPTLFNEFSGFKLNIPFKIYSNVSYQILCAASPWHRKFIEPEFIHLMKGKGVAIKNIHIKQCVENDQKEICLPKVTEHKILYSFFSEATWSCQTLSTPSTVNVEDEIQTLMNQYEAASSEDKLIIIDKVSGMIKTNRKVLQHREDILELEETLLEERSALEKIIADVSYYSL